MLPISNKTSTRISLIVSVLLVIALIVLLPWVPDVVRSMLDTADNVGDRAELSQEARTYVLIAAYAMIAVAFLAMGLLFFLLFDVLRERIFQPSLIRWLRGLSWCCFGEGALFFSIGFCFQIALGVGLAACFLGLCLRVVKNVIAEAIRIKDENDFTI
ncbi:MAG: DUF2975 domain-containing protein [Clostridia bacterium]|nr:DUF2975 domain-containing protein [Clostridia bacterium]